jgi:porin
MIYWFVLFATIILFPAIAEAQVQTGTTYPSLLIPLEPPETFPPSGTQGGYLFNLRPLGADFGQTLADHGIYIVGRNLSDEIATVSGGVKRGLSYQGFTQLGFDLDMQRIAGLPGGAVHFLLDDLAGQPFYAWSGSAYLNNRLFAGDGPAVRVNELSYEQNLFDRQVNLRLGRLPAYTQFDGSELYCTFITSLCRTPAAYTFDRGYPPYLASSWAAVAQIRIAGPFYTNIGVYENEPIAATTNHGGFPGPDWGLNYANGATFPVQFGYRTTLQNDQYPRAFSVGGFYVTGTYADPLLNTNGQNRILAGGTPKLDYGQSQVWVQAQQMVYRPDASDRGLTVFGGANWATSGEPNVERMVFAGAYYKGPFAPRPNDTLGLAVSLVDVNPRLTQRINSVLSKTTRGQASASEIDYEAYYGVAVAPGMTLKPFVGFMSHPDQVNNPAPSGNITHAVYLGVLFEVDMAHLFGLPTLSR